MDDQDAAHFFLCQDCVLRVPAEGLRPRILAREDQPFPRLARERPDYLRTVDAESLLPPGRPATCSRLIFCGEKG